MALNKQTQTLLVILAILFIIYLFYRNSESPIHNEGMVEVEGEAVSEENNALPENMDEEMARQGSMEEASVNSASWLDCKFANRNTAVDGYKTSAYNSSGRGNLGPSSWANYFDSNNNLISDSQVSNDGFLPMDETNNEFAVFKQNSKASCGSNQHCPPEDLFNVDKYLPQEVNDQWWDMLPEPISVKNRHLINVTKPIGVNTIGNSLRNATWDLRGDVPNPKYAISPWLNSTIEPDTNIKPLY